MTDLARALDEATRRRDFAKEQLIITAHIVAAHHKRGVPPDAYLLGKVVEDSDAVKSAEAKVIEAREAIQAASDAAESRMQERGMDLAGGIQ